MWVIVRVILGGNLNLKKKSVQNRYKIGVVLGGKFRVVLGDNLREDIKKKKS